MQEVTLRRVRAVLQVPLDVRDAAVLYVAFANTQVSISLGSWLREKQKMHKLLQTVS